MLSNTAKLTERGGFDPGGSQARVLDSYFKFGQINEYQLIKLEIFYKRN